MANESDSEKTNADSCYLGVAMYVTSRQFRTTQSNPGDIRKMSTYFIRGLRYQDPRHLLTSFGGLSPTERGDQLMCLWRAAHVRRLAFIRPKERDRGDERESDGPSQWCRVSGRAGPRACTHAPIAAPCRIQAHDIIARRRHCVTKMKRLACFILTHQCPKGFCFFGAVGFKSKLRRRTAESSVPLLFFFENARV